MADSISIEALRNRLADEQAFAEEVEGDRKDELYAEGRCDALRDLINFLETVDS